MKRLLTAALVTAACSSPPATSPPPHSLTFGTNTGRSNGCVIAGEGDVYCWSSTRQANVIGAPSRELEPGRAYRVEGLPPMKLVRSAESYVWGSSEDAGVFRWGFNANGSPPERLDGLGSVSELATDGTTACGLIGSDVWCWGENAAIVQRGSDGGSGGAPRIVQTGAIDIAMSYGGACATLQDRTRACWGSRLSNEPRTDIAYYSNECALTRAAALECFELAGPVHGVKRLGRRDGAFNIGNCIAMEDDGRVECWDFPDGFAGRRVIRGVVDAVELAVSPYPTVARRLERDHACAVLKDGGVVCFNIDDNDGGVRFVPGLP